MYTDCCRLKLFTARAPHWLDMEQWGVYIALRVGREAEAVSPNLCRCPLRHPASFNILLSESEKKQKH